METEFARSGTMTFRMTGDAYTRTARDRLLEQSFARAIRFLDDALEGLSADVSLAVLKGEQRFIGDSRRGLDVAPDDTPEGAAYREQLQRHFAGRMLHQDQWWKPSARMESLGSEDMDFGTDLLGMPRVPWRPSSATENRWGSARSMFYAQDNETVFRVRDAGKTFVAFFETTTEPPPWMPVHATPTDAVQAFLAAGGHLEVRRAADRPEVAVLASFASSLAQTSDRIEQMAADFAVKADRLLGEDTGSRVPAAVLPLREKILAQAAGDLVELRLAEQDRVVGRVPRAPFEQWALRKTKFSHLAPHWQCVSKSGWKVNGDNPYHTDWWLGADPAPTNFGFDAYFSELQRAADDTAFALQQKLGSVQCQLIVPGAPVTGTVGQEIVVLQDLRPENLSRITSAQAVITEQGGALAHLAVIALERNIPMLRLADARTVLRDGMTVSVYPEEQRVQILSGDVS